jgi:hypothetical protein
MIIFYEKIQTEEVNISKQCQIANHAQNLK